VDVLGKLKGLFGGSGQAKGDAGLPVIDVARRFELLNTMGQGSMSKVWRARDKKLGRTVCVKLLDKAKTEDFERRFPPSLNKPKEGAICVALKHKNIVQTYEFGLTTEGAYYLVMELIDGQGLNFLVETQSERLNGRRVSYLAQMADALEYMHQKKYLHRDICPRNIMVTRDHGVKFIDFGLTIPYTPVFCKPGNRTGTLAYLAPEVIRRVTTDHRVDLFALGVTAYEMYTFGMPWEKAASVQTALSHMNHPARDPRDLRRDLDQATAKFLLKSVERDPRDRFQTAADFREAVLALPDHY
jgi:serine/threonine protein kinase